ncbi:hypothetical protein QCA50_000598 [Cerrena zonata]|uniref:Secreted mucin n=1 Tax=Cerrena zonata TaxID=2478898 RepID=A0AAW0GX30_9APHY
MKPTSAALLRVVALVALVVTVSAGISGSECVPLLRGNPQDPLMLSPIAGPSNHHFDFANGSYTGSELASVPTSSALPSPSVEPTHTGSEPMPTGETAQAEGSSSVGDENLEERAPPTEDELKAVFAEPDECIPSGRSCLIEAVNPPKFCCSRFCVAALGVGGWCK